jgi:pimeloyl-ACP methyl ester carboxylesterase
LSLRTALARKTQWSTLLTFARKVRSSADWREARGGTVGLGIRNQIELRVGSGRITRCGVLMDFDYVLVPGLISLLAILIVWFSVRRWRSLSARVSHSRRRLAERIVLVAVILVMVALAGCSEYNSLARLWFRAHNPAPGAIYIVDSTRMRLYCIGNGEPTVVLESALGNGGLVWGGVQPILAKSTRVCSYDRAGYGWSDARTGARDADHIADELHGLLRQAKVSGPIVLMGHSIAGLYVRDFATRYPEGLVGIVFVDAATPLQEENPAFKDTSAKARMGVQLGRVMSVLGVPRLQGECAQSFPGFDASMNRIGAEDYCVTEYATMSAELDQMPQSGRETVRTGPYGALPILIFSQDGSGEDATSAMKQAWNQMQEDLKKLSTRSRRIIARNSGHYIQLDRYELIEKEVPMFIEQIRDTVPDSPNYGSTVTE